MPNPGGIMRPGMFATATLYSIEKQTYTSVPASAILHLHDRDWVFIPAQGKFRRTEVTSGAPLPNNMQEILTGLTARPAGDIQCGHSPERNRQ